MDSVKGINGAHLGYTSLLTKAASISRLCFARQHAQTAGLKRYAKEEVKGKFRLIARSKELKLLSNHESTWRSYFI
jgi:hypothetical protein